MDLTIHTNRYIEWSILSHSEITWTHSQTFMESRLKTTHCLFKWCRQLKAVFSAVYWLLVLGNLNFIYIVRMKMAMGISAKQLHWTSLNKHFLSNASPFVDFYMVILDQVKICWASENIC